jgi:hypothetical protein
VHSKREMKGAQSTSVDERAGRVAIGVWVVTAELQREIDEKYGKGPAVLEGTLKPVGS